MEARAMTYQVVVANEWRNMIVRVEADDPRTAHEIAEWIVENRKQGHLHEIPQDGETDVDEGSR
jgi:hypothetical protein